MISWVFRDEGKGSSSGAEAPCVCEAKVGAKAPTPVDLTHTAFVSQPRVKGKRTALFVLLLTFAISPLVAVRLAAQSDHARQFGMKIKCMCRGCDMSAGGCSHPGGAFSGPCETAKGMLKEVDQHIARGESDDEIMKAFVAEYGSVVYVEPPKHGFGLVAWVMPVFYTILGVGLVVFVMQKWRKKAVGTPTAVAHAGTAPDPSDPLARARAQADRETEE